jgi:hypothetical protein
MVIRESRVLRGEFAAQDETAVKLAPPSDIYDDKHQKDAATDDTTDYDRFRLPIVIIPNNAEVDRRRRRGLHTGRDRGAKPSINEVLVSSSGVCDRQ